MRRFAIVTGFGLLMVIGGAVPGLAQEAELDSWFERAKGAEFSGRQFVVCETPDGERSEFVTLSQMDGVLVVDAGSGQSVISRGELYDLAADGTVLASTFDGHSPWSLDSRYEVSDGATVTVLGRQADVVNVLEGELVRLELAFDQTTGAVLRSVSFNGDGSVYCTSSFLSFSEDAVMGAMPVAQTTAAIVPLEAQGVLPDTLAGFGRRDTFVGPAGSVAGFYSDGIFSFTVLATDRAINIAGLAQSTAVSFGDDTYQRVFLAGRTLYSWTTRDGGFVLLGDQPLDLQEAVLAELPEPGRANLIKRFWRRLFG